MCSNSDGIKKDGAYPIKSSSIVTSRSTSFELRYAKKASKNSILKLFNRDNDLRK